MKKLLAFMLALVVVAPLCEAQPIIQRLRQLRDVSADSPSNADTLYYNSATGMWYAAPSTDAAVVLDAKSVGDLGQPGTNTLSGFSAIDAFMIRRMLTTPILTDSDVASYEIDWNAGLSWYVTGGTNVVQFTDVNRPTNSYDVWGGRMVYFNSWTNSADPILPDGWLSKSGLWPGAIGSNSWLEVSFDWNGASSNVWFDWQTEQATILPKIYGGSGNIYGVADHPEYASPTLSLSSLTNLYPDLSQGPSPVPLLLSTNLFIADPTGMSVSGRSAEMELPVQNTNETGSVRIDWDSDWTPVGFATNYHTLSNATWAVLKLKSYYTNRYIFLVGGSGAFSGGESSPAWTPGVLWDFETGTEPSGWNVNTSTYDPLVNYGYSADPLFGTYSLAMTGTNVATYTVRAPTQTDLDEVWVAFGMRVSAAPSGLSTIAELLTSAAGYRAYLRLSTSRLVTAHMASGATTAHPTAIPTTGKAYVKMRYKKGTGANAEVELWVMTDPSAGWGTSVSRSDGTQTDQVAMWHFYNHTNFGNGKLAYYDQLIWSAEDIPASYFIGL